MHWLCGCATSSVWATLVWGSDYPHAESTFPHSRAILDQVLADVPDDERRQILDTTPAGLYFP